MANMKKILIILFLALLMSGCSSSSGQKWYKPGCNQNDFDFDSMDCNRSAKEIARQATLTGNGIDYDVLGTAYINCITSRGWNPTHPDAEPKNIEPIELANIDKNTLAIFDHQINIPPSFKLNQNQIYSHEDIRSQAISFQAQGPVYLNLTIQESLSQKFVPTDYPVKEAFIVYDKGPQNNQDASQLRWTVFTGNIKEKWVTAIGGYFLLNPNQRITFTMTQNMGPSPDIPPPGLSITRTQKQKIETFYNNYAVPLLRRFNCSLD
ncbi:MAG: hypothetical protein QM498_08830 [Desulfobacterium sp.]